MAVRELLEPNPPPAKLPPAGRRWHHEWLYARAAYRRFRGRLVVLILVLLIGTLFFRLLYRGPGGSPSLVRCFYYSWTLIFFEPQVSLPSSPLLAALFFVVPLLGLCVIVEGIVDFSLLLRDRRRNEREWCRMLAAEMRKHVVLVGFGRTGFRTYGYLRAMQVPVLIVESDKDNPFIAAARADHTPVLIANGRENHVHDEANTAAARSIICCTNDDLGNLEIALDARRVNPEIRVIVRMFDPDLADKVREGFRIDVALSTSAMAAPSIAAAACDRSIRNSYAVGGELFVTSEVRVEPGSRLAVGTIADMYREVPLSVIAVRRPGGAVQAFPCGDQALQADDELVIQVRFDDLPRLQALNQPAGAAAAG